MDAFYEHRVVVERQATVQFIAVAGGYDIGQPEKVSADFFTLVIMDRTAVSLEFLTGRTILYKAVQVDVYAFRVQGAYLVI